MICEILKIRFNRHMTILFSRIQKSTTRIRITIGNIVARTFQIVTIVQLKSLPSKSRESGGVSGGFYYPSRRTTRPLFVRIHDFGRGSREETETIYRTIFSFLVCPEMNLINSQFIFRV